MLFRYFDISAFGKWMLQSCKEESWIWKGWCLLQITFECIAMQRKESFLLGLCHNAPYCKRSKCIEFIYHSILCVILRHAVFHQGVSWSHMFIPLWHYYHVETCADYSTVEVYWQKLRSGCVINRNTVKGSYKTCRIQTRQPCKVNRGLSNFINLVSSFVVLGYHISN